MKKKMLIISLALLALTGQPAAAMKRKRDEGESHTKNTRKPKKQKLIYPLHDAAKSGDIEQAKKLLKQGHTLTDPNKLCQLPIHIAVEHGQVEFIRFILENGGNPNAFNYRRGLTPLHVAAIGNKIDVARVLIKAGANPAICCIMNGKNVMHWAAMHGHHSFVEFLLGECSCDPDMPCEEGLTPIFSAAQIGHLGIAKLLVDRGCTLKPVGKCKLTPLHTASGYGQVAMIKFLIDAGCDINSLNYRVCTPLHFAVTVGGQLEAVETLVKAGCDVNAQTESGETACFIAVSLDHTDIFLYLLDKCKNIPNKYGRKVSHKNGRFIIVDKDGTEVPCKKRS